MVATGASAAIIPVPGLKETPHMTNSNFWNLEELPKKMGVIGAGPIGLEMSQAMQRFGCEVMTNGWPYFTLFVSISFLVLVLVPFLVRFGFAFRSSVLVRRVLSCC